MNKKTNRILKSLLFFSTSFIYFLLAYIGLKMQNIDLGNYERREGVIIDKGIDTHYGSKGRESEVFFIKLQDLDEPLGVYRMSKNYEDLLKAVNIGDSVTVYYKGNSNQSENVNIDLIQLEKDGAVVIAKQEYERKESSIIYVGFILGILTVILSYLYYKGKILKHL